MTLKGFIATAFALYLALRNICVLELTHAAVPGESERAPMSRDTNVECPFAHLDSEGRPTGVSPCASGHCLAKPKPQPSSLQSIVFVQDVVATLVQPPALETVFFCADAPVPESRENPPPLIALHTIVLRQ